MHLVARTSPLGEDFVGKCVLCGTTGITIGVATSPDCPTPKQAAFTEAVSLAMGERDGTNKSQETTS
jgi:hypothetical protein